MRAANEQIEGHCDEDPNLVFADIAKVTLGEDGKPRPEIFKKDGLHLNEAGYASWKTVIEPLIGSK